MSSLFVGKMESTTTYSRYTYNPYTQHPDGRPLGSKSGAQATNPRTDKDGETTTYFDVMLAASKEQATSRKRKASTKEKKKSAARDPHQAAAARAAAQQRKKRREDAEASRVDQGAAKGDWQSKTWDFLTKVLNCVKKNVGFSQHGDRQLRGQWPSFCYSPLVQPSKDPLNWRNILGDEVEEDDLTKSDFAMPDLMILSPEERWPQLYPDGKPCCPFHPGFTDCVEHLGYSHYFRRCYGCRNNVALIGRRYKCTILEKRGDQKYTFFSYSAGVLNQAPAYVQGWWRDNGFRLSHRAGLSWQVVDQLRSLLANGSGVSGFYRSLLEGYKQSHANRAKMWRGYSSAMYVKSTKEHHKARSLFFDFDDPQSEAKVPSLAYLIEVVIREIELKIPYYTRKLQMIGGRNLSADHSHKVAKVVLIQSERGFDGIYTIMNEFGKVLAFFFVNGTTLYEVEDALRKLDHRYQLHGFAGPIFFTTDRCCDEREFFSGTKNRQKKPIFTSFAEQYGSTTDSDSVPTDNCPETRFVQVPYLELPCDAIVPASLETAEMTAGEIIRQSLDNNWNVIGIDCEWAIGPAAKLRATQNNYERGPDTVAIGLPDGKTYVFELRRYRSFPKALRKLIEDPNIQKAARQISADKSKLRENGIELRGCIELGQLAKSRGVIPVATAGLDVIVEKLFGCCVEKDPTIRLSDWDLPLKEQQVKYAAIDVYAHMFCYLKLDQIGHVDARATPNPKSSDLPPGTQVLLYNTNKSAVVASGVITCSQVVCENGLYGTATDRRHVKVRVIHDDVRIPSTVIKKDAGRRSFHDLFEVDGAKENPDGFVEVAWSMVQLRIAPPETERQEEVSVVTRNVAVPVPSDSNNDDEGEQGSIPDGTVPDGTGAVPDGTGAVPDGTGAVPNGSNDIGDEPDSSINIEHIFKKEDDGKDEGNHKGTKQDLEHIFLRFARVLSKEHGAFPAFMARLSDAFFVASQADIKLIQAALRKHGLTDDQIKAKPWQYYKKRVRRTVPGREILERDFKRVVNLFADLTDGKTGKPLFSNKAWALVRSTLKHIRKGCLSDIPGECYYVQTGVDSLGIPLFSCIRGTSALEGFHQKIRQLIRAFNCSPRFAIALLHEFIHRWNHDIDVRILGLPQKYANYYDGWEVEQEIEIASEWPENEEIPHPSWQSTKDYTSTGETFGLNTEGIGIGIGIDVLDGGNGDVELQAVEDDDAELEAEALRVVDAINDGTLGEQPAESDETTAENVLASAQILSESAAWVSSQFGLCRALGKVETSTEETFYRENYHRFQNHRGQEADNFTSIAFGAFASFWNDVIKEEEAGRRPKTDMTLKTAFHLQAYWKKLRRDCNIAATLLPVHRANKEMRREMRGPSRSKEVQIPDAQTPSERQVTKDSAAYDDEDDDFAAMDVDDDVEDHGVSGESTPAKANHRVAVPAFDGRMPTGIDPGVYQEAVPRLPTNSNDGAKKKPARQSPRCRQCGHEYGDGSQYHSLHKREGFGGSGQRRFCLVAEQERLEGFPLPEGAKMPRRSRSK